MARREGRFTPRVYGGVLYSDTGSCSVDSPEWATWLGSGGTFYYESNAGTFTARCEQRGGSGRYWYAFRRSGKRLYKAYIGQMIDVTADRLHRVAMELERKIAT
jgi:hypothetical protein